MGAAEVEGAGVAGKPGVAVCRPGKMEASPGRGGETTWVGSAGAGSLLVGASGEASVWRVVEMPASSVWRRYSRSGSGVVWTTVGKLQAREARMSNTTGAHKRGKGRMMKPGNQELFLPGFLASSSF